MLELSDARRLKYEKICDGTSSPRKYDFLWMTDFMFNDNYTTPMWVGWNAKYSPQNKTTQKIWYLPQINQSSTSTSVVAETMRRSLRIASEGQKENISVTYDHAIAKLTMQIQAEEKPTFDKIFTSLGSFHLEITFFFSALGKIIEESGGPHILEKVLRGKSYKRCKRMHELLAIAFEILHFESRLTTRNWEKVMGTILQGNSYQHQRL